MADPRSPVRTRPTICLNMIVRDEAHVVRETLDSVWPYIDYWVIVDTGSKRTALNRKFLPPGWSLLPGATVSTIVGSTEAYAVDVNWKLDGRDIRLPALIGDFNFPYGASGLLGADVLGTFTSVRFDYVRMVLILED